MLFGTRIDDIINLSKLGNAYKTMDMTRKEDLGRIVVKTNPCLHKNMQHGKRLLTDFSTQTIDYFYCTSFVRSSLQNEVWE